MSKPLLRATRWGKPQAYVSVEEGATLGAEVGVNLFLNGVLVRAEDILNIPTPPAPQFPITYWRNILEIPPNVTALAETTTAGLYTVTGIGTSATRTLQNGAGIDWTNPGGLAGDPQAVFNAATAEVAHLPGATYKTVQKLIDVLLSPGIITGAEVTQLTATSVRIAACTAIVRIADDNVSELRFINVPSQDFSVPDVQVTHFYALDYNGGSPLYIESTVTENWDRDTQIPVGSALRGDGMLNVTPNPYRVGDVITNLIQRLDAVGPVQRDNSVGGLQLGEAGTRNVTVSPGRLWSRVSDFTVPAKNSSIDTMASLFFNGTNLTVTSGITQWDNQNFNDLGTGTLVAIGNNKWANLWFFMSFDGTKYGFAYGTGQHNTLGDAANEGVPSYLTQNFFNQFILLGRFVFQESAVTAAQIESAFDRLFTTQAVNTHNDLGGLQGGTTGEFYHLTAAQQADVAALAAAAAGIVAKTGAGAYAARSFPNGTGFTWTNPAGITGDPTLVLDATLAALASQNWAANAMPVGTGADALTQLAIPANTFPARSSAGNVAAKPITDFALTLVDDATAAAARTTLGAMADLQPFMVATISANQALVAGVTTKVNLDTDVTDPNGWFDTATGRFTPQQAGVYSVISTVAFVRTVASTAVGQRLIAYIFKNGAQEVAVTAANLAQNTTIEQAVGLIQMNGTTDYIEMFALTNATDAYSISSGAANTTLRAVRVSA